MKNEAFRQVGSRTRSRDLRQGSLRLLTLFVTLLMPLTSNAVDQIDVAAAMVWGRVVERVLITLAATGSLVLGFLLFRVSVERGGEFSAGQKGAYVKLKDVGPGTFFALFGAIILVASAWNPIVVGNSVDRKNTDGSIERIVNIRGALSAAAPDTGEWRRKSIEAITTLELYLEPSRAAPDEQGLARLNATVPALAPVKREMVDAELGEIGAFERFSRLRTMQTESPMAFNNMMKDEQDRQWFEQAERLITTPLDAGP